MKIKFLFSLIIVASFFALSFQSVNNVSSTLTVTVTDIKNSSGEIDFNLFSKADGFPDDATKAYKHLRGKISNGKCSVTFQNLPFGQYSIIIYHDANSNNKCDETWFGMPKEGVGISNNPSLGAFSPPSFEKGKFSLSKEEYTTSIPCWRKHLLVP